MAELSLSEMQRRVLAFRAERDWEQFHDPKSQAISLMLEAAELAEIVQWHSGETLDAILDEKREAVADELVDVLNWVLMIAADRGVDLSAAFERKLAANAEKYPVETSRGVADKYRRASD